MHLVSTGALEALSKSLAVIGDGLGRPGRRGWLAPDRGGFWARVALPWSRCWRASSFDVEIASCVPARAPCGFWNSGRSQRTSPCSSSLARSRLRSTRRSRIASSVRSWRPAVGGEDGGVQLVVELPEHGDQPMFVDLFLLGGQRFPRPQLLQHVVHAGHGQVGVQLLLALAVGIEGFAQGADATSVPRRRGRGRFQAAGFDVPGVVPNTELAASC